MRAVGRAGARARRPADPPPPPLSRAAPARTLRPRQAVTKAAEITDLRLDFKSGGKSGTYDRAARGG
jgi:hypothetical protein